MDVRELVSLGCRRNIIVYDGNALPGQFTGRLVAQMKTASRRMGMRRMTTLFVPTDALLETPLVQPPPVAVGTAFLGVSLKPLPPGAKRIYLSESCCGTLVLGDHDLIIGLCESGDVLLGSY